MMNIDLNKADRDRMVSTHMALWDDNRRDAREGGLPLILSLAEYLVQDDDIDVFELSRALDKHLPILPDGFMFHLSRLLVGNDPTKHLFKEGDGGSLTVHTKQ